MASKWDDQVNRARSAGTTAMPSLPVAVASALSPQLKYGYTLGIIDGLLTCVARPLLLRELVLTIERGTPASEADTVWLTLVMTTIVLVEGWCGVMYRHVLIEDTGSAYVASLFSLLLGKILRTSGSASSAAANNDDCTVMNEPVENAPAESDEVSMCGNDLIRSYNMMMWASGFPIAVSGIPGGAAVCIYLIGWIPALCGLGVAVLVLLANVMLTGRQGRVEHLTLSLADERMSILTQILETIRAVKFFVWESEYFDRITSVRLNETRAIRHSRMLHVTSVALGRVSPVISAAVAILAFRFMGNNLRSADVFAIVTAFQSMRLPLIMAPLTMSALENVKVSLRRLQAFLNRPDHFGHLETAPSIVEHSEKSMPRDVILAVHEAMFSWSGATEKVPINGVRAGTVHFERGTLTAIVGPVGAGKTTLLYGLIGELTPVSGVLHRSVSKCRVAYVPQHAFILSGTVVENITFGRPLDRNLLRKALAASAFERDLEQLSHGEKTEIGERGTTLSGGQQQRLSIARALYGNPELLILDDPLSAVDSRVCNHIFEHAIVRPDGTVPTTIMVLNQLHLLKSFDRVLYVEENSVLVNGTPSEVMQHPAYQAWVTNLSESHNIGKEDSKSESLADERAGIDALPGRGNSMPEVTDTVLTNAEKAIHVVENEKSAASETTTENTAYESMLELGKEEKLQTGTFSLAAVGKLSAACGRVRFFGTVLLLLFSYGMVTFSDIWLGLWASQSEAEPDGSLSASEDRRYALVYGIAVLILAVGVILGSFSFCYSGERVSNKLHSQCIGQLLYAPFMFFLSTPIGRITSRFSSDLVAVDLYLFFWIDNLSQLGSTLLIFTVATCVLVPPLTVIVLVCGFVFAYTVKAVDRSNREIKRISNAAMGPVLSNVQEALHGRVLARAMGLEDFFMTRHHTLVDKFSQATFSSWCLISWMQFIAAGTSALVSIAVTIISLRQKGDGKNIERTAVSVMYSFLIPYYMAFVAQIYSMVAMYFTSYERILEYMNIPQEPPHSKEIDTKLGRWPSEGKITFENVSMRYGADLPLAIKRLSVDIPGGCKVGVVGRTGAGKSSLAAILFRLVPVDCGTVKIDDVDVSTVGLNLLRRGITVIPQDPTLIEGTVRENLDPFGRWNDNDIVAALTKATLSPGMINQRVTKGGQNLSAGERQLLCFARAILYHAVVIVMDEPTANCDQVTDDTIQNMVRREFAHSTLLTIAHRLSTVIDYDRILVMDRGEMCEFGTPAELLRDPNGHFTQMVNALGTGEAAHLRHVAEETHATSDEKKRN